MIQKKLAETKNQHYVPQFYQRFFSADANHKTIGAYVVDKRKYIPSAPIKKQSSGDYFYSSNQKIEDALCQLEILASKVIGLINSNPIEKLSKEDAYALYVFTFMQIGRTLDRVNIIQELTDKIARNLLKKYVEVERNTDSARDVEQITDEVIDSIEVELTEPGLFTLGNHAQLVNTCIDLKMKVLINRTGCPFITSDNPACMYSMFLERVGECTYAFGSKGLMFYMPISKDVAVIYYDSQCYKMGDKKKDYVEVTQKDDVINLNTLTACYANKMLYCLDGSISERELEEYATKREKIRPKDRVETIDGIKTDKGEIIGAFTTSIYCNLRLSFIKELPIPKAITKINYNPAYHRLRPIAYLKDQLIIN